MSFLDAVRLCCIIKMFETKYCYNALVDRKFFIHYYLFCIICLNIVVIEGIRGILYGCGKF